MLLYKNGDILNAEENVICHQVNVEGIMGGGLAKQIADKYTYIETDYINFCKRYNNDYELLRGCSYLCQIEVGKDKYVANCFTQKENFDTDYEYLTECFKNLLKYSKKNNLTICIPYKYGCGIANGDWDNVCAIFEKLSNEIGIDIVIYKLESE